MNTKSLENNINFYKGKKVLLTGHTGFKGSWMTAILNYLGAETIGYALQAPNNGLYTRINGDLLIKSVISDLMDRDKISDVIYENKPDIIIHMAAFGFVSECYDDPIRAYETNVIGTQNILEAVRKTDSVKSIVVVSTDKVYENHGDGECYTETSALGGIGPYSGSKTAMEILVNDYRETYFSNNNRCIGISTVRASNVLGGGDHIETRLIPSILKAVSENKTVELRNPNQTRPWQSVFDALNGYLTVGRYIYDNPTEYSGAWNIGPKAEGIQSVQWVLETIQNYFSGIKAEKTEGFRVVESETLGLDINKAMNMLDWEPILSVDKTIELVAEFYKRQLMGESEQQICLDQIRKYYGGLL